MTETLIVMAEGQIIGRMERLPRTRNLEFTYADTWRQLRSSYPISLHMPLAIAKHTFERMEPFLWNLLPDNQVIIERWAQQYQISIRDAFGFLTHVGEDCAGAIQFVRPERVETLSKRRGGIAWLSKKEIAERLATVRQDYAATRYATDTGHFSLAGTQAKTAFYYDKKRKRWGIPSGHIPTTHILKPPISGLEGHPENEHLCLELARELGLPAARSRVLRFGNEVAIGVERFDRIVAQSRYQRVHQEDLCQALGRPSSQKYQNEGGPSPTQIVELLRNHSNDPEEDVMTFVKTLAFHWVIAGTDAHAKNYAVLLAGEGQVRLAPLYDVASALPYDNFRVHTLKLAMKIGEHYRIKDIRRRDWERLAQELDLPEQRLCASLHTFTQAIPSAMARLSEQAHKKRLAHPIVQTLTERITARARSCAKLLATI